MDRFDIALGKAPLVEVATPVTTIEEITKEANSLGMRARVDDTHMRIVFSKTIQSPDGGKLRCEYQQDMMTLRCIPSHMLCTISDSLDRALYDGVKDRVLRQHTVSTMRESLGPGSLEGALTLAGELAQTATQMQLAEHERRAAQFRDAAQLARWHTERELRRVAVSRQSRRGNEYP